MCACPWGRGRTVTGVNQGSALDLSKIFPSSCLSLYHKPAAGPKLA